MSIENKKKQFEDIIMGMLDTYIKKNHDYGDSFNETLDEYGLLPAIIRMKEKLKRVETLNKKQQQVHDEAIEDSLLDLANYAIMTVMWLYSKVYELCPHCEETVMLKANMEYQKCPSCGSIIKPCSLCNMDNTECNNCVIGSDLFNRE